MIKNIGATRADFEPFVRFKEFGDSNINFAVYFEVKEYGKKFILRHEFIKALKAAYDKENIEIAWPTTKVFFGDKAFLRKK